MRLKQARMPHSTMPSSGIRGFSRLEFTPLASVGLEHGIRRRRSPGSGGIVRQVLNGILRPVVQNWSHKCPSGLNAIAVREERAVTEHCIQQQALIAVRRRRSESLGIREVHVDRADRHARPRQLRAKSQRDALVRLDANRDEVVLNAFGSFTLCILEDTERWLLEDDRDVG